MTERTEEIRAREALATKGPWTVEDPMGSPAVIADGHKQVYDWVFIAHFDTGNTKHSVKADRNAAFIAAARQDIPYLLDLNDAKDAEIERLREDLKSHRAMMLEAAEEFDKMKAALRGRFGA